MKVKDKYLMPLFPALYSRRNQDNRDWRSLNVPRLRVMGPNWTVGANLKPIDDDMRTLSMTVLADSEASTEILGEKNFHRPTIMKAEIGSLWGKWKYKFGFELKRSRLSALAVNATDRSRGRIFPRPFLPDETEVHIDPDLAKPILLAPFGRVPANASETLFLPASRLVSGEIWVDPVEGYIDVLRDTLGLDPATEVKNSDHIVLLPDGFAVAGALSLPWREDSLSAWFKVTAAADGSSSLDALSVWKEQTPSLVWNSAVEELRAILVEAERSSSTVHWSRIRAIERIGLEDLAWPCKVENRILLYRQADDSVQLLGRRVQAQLGDRNEADSAVLTIRPDGFQITGTPNNLIFTAGTLRSDENWDALYAYKSDEEAKAEYKLELMSVTSASDILDEGRSLVVIALVFDAGLHIRIFDASGEKVVDKVQSEMESGDALKALTTLMKSNSLPVDSDLTAEEKQDIVVKAASVTDNILTDEKLLIGRQVKSKDGTDKRVVELAVPMLSNAAKLRDAMDFDEPRPDNWKKKVEKKDKKKKWTWTSENRLWLFTPIARGWLHWAFPNATIATLALENTPQPKVDNKKTTSFGSWAISSSEKIQSRDWQLDLSGAKSVYLDAVLERREKSGWQIAKVTVMLDGLSIAFRGLLPVTAFQQTHERILPEAAERALRGTTLDAVTPDLLIGSELASWRESEKGGLRVSAQVNNLVLRPIARDLAPGATADSESLDLTVRWPKKNEWGYSVFGLDQSESRPWLWLRHPNLPTAQTMPLATAGDESRRPSALRELAPLRRDKKEEVNTYVFYRAFDMRSSFVDLDEETFGTTVRPTFQKPLIPWIDEVGMAMTTLPSVTLFPGLLEGGGLPLENTGWGPSVEKTMVELRHDISLTDEGYATAQLPPPPTDEKEQLNIDSGEETLSIDLSGELENDSIEERHRSKATSLAFDILQFNAPGNETREATPWLPVWTERNRSLALAATESRRLIDRPADREKGRSEYTLSNVFYGVELPMDPDNLVLDWSLVFEATDPETEEYEPGTTRNRLVRAGSITITPNPDYGPPQNLPGLPATGDLMGISGGFFDGNRKRKIQRGGLVEQRIKSESDESPQELRDQGGWEVESKPFEAGLFVQHRRITRHSALLKAGKPEPTVEQFDLVGLSRTLSLTGDNGAKIRFHFRDVPCTVSSSGELRGDLRAAWYDESPTDGVPRGLNTASAGLAVARNHLHGFIWSLEQDRSDGLIGLGPFLFNPLALISVVLNEADDQKISAKVNGRVLLPPAEAGGAPILGSGEACLTLTLHTHTHTHTQDTMDWALTVNDLELPLIDPALDDLLDDWRAPMLMATQLTLSSTGFNLASGHTAALVFELGNVRRERPLKPKPDDLFHLVDTGKELPEDSDLYFSDAEVILTPVTSKNTKTGQIPQIRMTLEGQIGVFETIEQVGDKKAYMELGERIAISGKRPDASESNSTFVLGGTKLPARLDEIDFDDSSVAMNWTFIRDGNVAILGALKVDMASGAVLALLGSPVEKSGFKARSEHVAMHAKLHHSTYESRKAEIELSFDSARSTDDVLVHGHLDGENVFSWPILTIEEHGDAWQEGRQDDDGKIQIQHRFSSEFDAARLSLVDLGHGRAHLAARVTHWLEWPGTANGTTNKWQCHQVVVLSSAEAMKRVLEKLRDSGETGVLVGTQLSSKKKHITVERRLMVSGLSTSQIVGLATRLEKARNTLVVDASAHHLLSLNRGKAMSDQEATSLIHLPVPALSVLGSAIVHDIFEPASLGNRVTLQRPKDLTYRDGFAILTPQAKARLDEQMGHATARSRQFGTDPATVLVGDVSDKRHRTVFQGVTSFRGATGDPDQSHPWADVAMCLALFRESKLTYETSGLTLRQSNWTGQEMLNDSGLVDSKNQATIKTKAAYQLSWSSQFLGDQAHYLVPGPQYSPSVKSSRIQTQIVLLAPRLDGTNLREIARRDLRKKVVTDDLDPIIKWAETTMFRATPWARAGLLLFFDLWAGLIRLVMARAIVTTQLARAVRRPRLAAVIANGPMVPQGQRRMSPPANAEDRLDGIVAGYLPERTNVETLTSEPGDLPVEGQTKIRLTASGSMIGVALSSSSRRILEETSGSGSQYWTSDREVVSFRPYEPPVSKTEQTRVTFAMPPGTQGPLPAALLPARKVPAIPAAESVGAGRGYLPPAQYISMVGGRTGVFTARRVGIDAVSLDNDAVLSALEVPVWQRTPRPVELGVNDRPRASLFETAHAGLTPYPTAMLHGPARLGPLEFEEGGLDRSPRSTDALLLRLRLESGLLPLDWYGEFTISLENYFRAPDPDSDPDKAPNDDDPLKPARWLLQHALLEIDGDIYQSASVLVARKVRGVVDEVLKEETEHQMVEKLNAVIDKAEKEMAIGDGAIKVSVQTARRVYEVAQEALNKETESEKIAKLQEAKANPGKDLEIGGASSAVTVRQFLLEDGRRAEDRFASLAVAEELVLTLILVRMEEGQGKDMVRRLMFRVRKGGAGGLVDAPAYLRFEDPSYNDRLTGQPQLDGVVLDNSNRRLMLLSERKDVRGDDYVETILAIQRDSTESSRPCFKKSDNGVIFVGEDGTETEVKLKLERRRPEHDEIVTLDIFPGVSKVTTSAQFLQIPLLLPLCKLQSGEAGPGPLLQPKDLLTLAAGIGGKWMRVQLTVVDLPVLPANPSAYGLLHLTNLPQDLESEHDARLCLPLYQRGADPTWTELVDPAEMTKGLVRRRGHFAWSTFIAALRSSDRFALQKSSGIGASWLPDDIDQDWLSLKMSTGEEDSGLT